MSKVDDARKCDNDNCPYLFEMHCIQSWFCVNGVTHCPTYRRTRRSPEELYGDLFESEDDKDDDDKNEQSE